MTDDPYLSILAPSLRGYVAVGCNWTTLHTEKIHTILNKWHDIIIIILCTCTSSCADIYHTPAERAPIAIKAMVVFLFHCLGLHHQPPAGDHTYTGY